MPQTGFSTKYLGTTGLSNSQAGKTGQALVVGSSRAAARTSATAEQACSVALAIADGGGTRRLLGRGHDVVRPGVGRGRRRRRGVPPPPHRDVREA